VRIKVHPGLCEGHGVCRRFAPSIYQLDADGYLELRLLDVPPGLERDAVTGAEACPARAISVLWETADRDRVAGTTSRSRS
jgi:ferredoxin